MASFAMRTALTSLLIRHWGNMVSPLAPSQRASTALVSLRGLRGTVVLAARTGRIPRAVVAGVTALCGGTTGQSAFLMAPLIQQDQTQVPILPASMLTAQSSGATGPLIKAHLARVFCAVQTARSSLSMHQVPTIERLPALWESTRQVQSSGISVIPTFFRMGTCEPRTAPLRSSTLRGQSTAQESSGLTRRECLQESFGM